MTTQYLARRWRVCALGIVLGLVAIYLAGCFIVDGKIEADGSGTIDLTYPVTPNVNVEVEKAKWNSSHVTLKSFALRPENFAQVVVAFDDVTALSTAEGFENVQVTKAKDGDDELMKIVIKNPHPNPTAQDPGKPGPKITMVFPGPVKEANRNATVTGAKVTWTVSLVDAIKNPMLDFTARYASATTTSTTTTSTSTTEPPKTTTTTAPPKGKTSGKKGSAKKS